MSSNNPHQNNTSSSSLNPRQTNNSSSSSSSSSTTSSSSPSNVSSSSTSVNTNTNNNSSSSSNPRPVHVHPHQHVPGSGCCEHEYIELSGNVINTASLPNSTQGDYLLSYIDTNHVICLNERIRDSCRTIFKPYNERNDKTRFMESDESDSELLFSIPFTASVRIRSICVSGGENGRTPSKLRLFINNEDADFTSVNDSKPQQEIMLANCDPNGDIWHPLKPAKFHALSSLQIHCIGNLANNTNDIEDVQIYYIGLKGDYLGPRATAPEVLVYEARPQLADHKVKQENRNISSLGL